MLLSLDFEPCVLSIGEHILLSWCMGHGKKTAKGGGMSEQMGHSVGY